MVRMRYLGPGHECRATLKRAYLDLEQQLRQCRPFKADYLTLTALLEQIGEAHQKLFNEPVRPPMRDDVANPSPKPKPA